MYHISLQNVSFPSKACNEKDFSTYLTVKEPYMFSIKLEEQSPIETQLKQFWVSIPK